LQATVATYASEYIAIHEARAENLAFLLLTVLEPCKNSTANHTNMFLAAVRVSFFSTLVQCQHFASKFSYCLQDLTEDVLNTRK